MKVRCQGCRNYFPKEEAHRRMGLGYVCSEDCMFLTRDRSQQTHTSSSASEIPTAVRSAVLARDLHQCRRCQTHRDLHIHHISYKSQGVDHSPLNLVSLCGAGNVDGCHGVVHSDKRIYQPLLRGVIWIQYVEDRYVTVPQFAQLIAQLGIDLDWSSQCA